MKVIIGTVLTQPGWHKGIVSFHLETGNRILTVIRTDPEGQKRDVLFLCIGQRLAVFGCEIGRWIITTKIRIITCNYYRNGVLLCGDSTETGIDPGDTEL